MRKMNGTSKSQILTQLPDVRPIKMLWSVELTPAVESIKKIVGVEVQDVERTAVKPTGVESIKKLLSGLFIWRIIVFNNQKVAKRWYRLALQKEFYMGIELLANQQGGTK